jgi:hypothetical protein
LQTFLFFPNPYAQLDHKGRLAGVVPEIEPLRRGGPPLNRKIGATLKLVEGSFKPGSEEDRSYPKGDVFHVFSVDPVEVNFDDSLTSEYNALVSRGELFDGRELPLEALAKARVSAIAAHVATYGKEPDVLAWVSQFALDQDVAEAAKLLPKPEASKPVAQPTDDSEKKRADRLAKAKEALAKKFAGPPTKTIAAKPQGD